MYIQSLGIKCVELQSVSEIDYNNPGEYPWGIHAK